MVVLIWQVLSLRIIDEDSEPSLRDGSGTLEVTYKVPLRLAGAQRARLDARTWIAQCAVSIRATSSVAGAVLLAAICICFSAFDGCK